MSPTFRLMTVTIAAVLLTMICCVLILNLAALLLYPLFFALCLIVTARLPVQSGPPVYLYELPHEAELVRLEKCTEAIELLLRRPDASFVLTDPETLEAVVRATEVATRARVMPPGRKDLQLTNDFGVYCQIAIEAFQKGYYGMLARCQHDPELPERLTALPEEEAAQEIERLALSILANC